jgi:hypothetical protein
MELSQLYSKHDKVPEMRRLIDDIRPFLEMVSKAKGGKVFKNLIDRFVELKSATADEVRCDVLQLLPVAAVPSCNQLFRSPLRKSACAVTASHGHKRRSVPSCDRP